MVIKKYLVNNMNEALTRIRYELGKDAVIISQRKVKKAGFKGLFSKKQIEVTAAIENSSMNSNEGNQKETNKRETNKKEEDFKESINDLKRIMNNELEAKKRNSRNKSNQDKLQTEEVLKEPKSELETEVKEMKALLNKVIKNTNKEENEDELLELLKETDIDLEFYKEFKSKIDDDDTNEKLREKLKEIIKNDIKVSNKELKGNIVLIGPTGVGKTTTIAKLAGKLSLVEKKKVGLITVDTYRIGAVEQLKTYAEIMNIPFKVVLTIKDMETAVEEMKDCDVVLIDTTGRSSKNKMQISELRAFVEKAIPESISIVISATTKNKDIKSILDGYRDLKYDQIIITKLDETTTYGSLYNIERHAKKPLRFITTGQNVPDDIQDVTKKQILNLILGEDLVC